MFLFFCFSPLIRSKRTAEIIWGTRKEGIITDSDLREIDLYSFQVSLVSYCCVCFIGSQFSLLLSLFLFLFFNMLQC